MSSDLRLCVETSDRCRNACLNAVTHALGMGGRYADDDLLGLLLDCAEVCRTTGDFIRRGSPRRSHTAAISADIAERCAEVCDEFTGDATMRACADACRRAADACRQLADEAWRTWAA